MHPKQLLHHRFVSDEAPSNLFASMGSVNDSLQTSAVRDEAALLLSIADIAQTELTVCPSALSDPQGTTLRTGFPNFPALGEQRKSKPMLSTPRLQSPRGLLNHRANAMGTTSAESSSSSSRIRAVSLDSPALLALHARRTPSPLASPPALLSAAPITPTTPVKGRTTTIRSARLSLKTRHNHVVYSKKANHNKVVLESMSLEEDATASSPSTSTKSKPLQGQVPKGVSITKIMRRKFSWKNYPEVRPIDQSCPCYTAFHSIPSHAYSPTVTTLLLSSFHLCHTARTVPHCQPRGVSPSLGAQLHAPAKAVQQPSHGATPGARHRTRLRL